MAKEVVTSRGAGEEWQWGSNLGDSDGAVVKEMTSSREALEEMVVGQ